MQRRRMTFSGRVQGVGFRATARSIAESYAITGWVQNQPDGTVALEAQGEAAEIDRFLEALRRRMGGLIRSEQALPAALQPAESGFCIER